MLRDGRRDRVLVSWDLFGGRAADPHHRYVAVRFGAEMRLGHEWTGGFERFWDESYDRLDEDVQDLKQARQEE